MSEFTLIALLVAVIPNALAALFIVYVEFRRRR
jgi:hypothetical protein